MTGNTDDMIGQRLSSFFYHLGWVFEKAPVGILRIAAVTLQMPYRNNISS
jgi:hypothetical protein